MINAKPCQVLLSNSHLGVRIKEEALAEDLKLFELLDPSSWKSNYLEAKRVYTENNNQSITI